MKNTVLKFGAITGSIITIMMVVSTALCYSTNNYEGNMIIGYIGIFIGYAFIFFGIKSYRDKVNGGIITFAEAFKVGFLIALVAATMYVIAWLIEYYFFMPDFMDKYADHVLTVAKERKMKPADIEKTVNEIAKMKELSKNPFYVVWMTYLEAMPLALIVTLISSVMLKRKEVK